MKRLLLVVFGLALAAIPPNIASADAPIVQDQGLDAAARKQFYHMTLGSEIIAFDLLKSMQSAKTGKPFFEKMDRFGLLADPDDVDGLPIGLSAAPAAGSPSKVKMLGMNCAACHVAELTYKGKSIRIDGAPGKADAVAFGEDLANSVAATSTDMDQFAAMLTKVVNSPTLGPALASVSPGGARFLKAQSAAELGRSLASLKGTWPEVPDLSDPPILFEPPTVDQRPALGALADAWAPAARKLIDATSGEGKPLGVLDSAEKDLMPAQASQLIVESLWFLKQSAKLYQKQDALRKFGGVVIGPGRVDDFRMAGNLMVGNLKIARPDTAPSSIPFTWNTDKVKWLGWDGNTDSSMQRNIGTAVAIGARFDRKTLLSSIAVDNVAWMEVTASAIKPPRWPAEIFGAIDAQKAQKGAALFQKLCVQCHVTDPGPPPDLLYDLKEIGTDPNRATNFAKDVADRSAGLTLPESLNFLLKVLYAQNKVDPAKALKLQAGRPETWRGTGKYAGRPLVAIWAAAPYLHNDSVPTLYDLLQPVVKRPRSFSIGTREFDPIKVGYDTKPSSPTDFILDTSLPGNRNSGHVYGTDLGDDDRMALIEYLKGS